MPRLTILRPCSADRSAMTPTERGQFCAQCQCEVIDFTRMRDVQVRTYLRQHEGRLCGQLRTDQMQRSLLAERPKRRYAWLLSLLALGSTPTMAQTYPIPEVGQLDLTVDAKTSSAERAALPTDTLRLRGRVVDEAKNPVKFAAVIVAGTDIGQYGRADGSFDLAVPIERIEHLEVVTLRIVCVGYETQQVLARPDQEICVQLRSAPTTYGEVVIIRTPWQAFWYRLGKPLRWMRRQW